MSAEISAAVGLERSLTYWGLILALAVKVGVAWLIIGLLYGAFLKAKHREELHVPL